MDWNNTKNKQMIPTDKTLRPDITCRVTDKYKVNRNNFR